MKKFKKPPALIYYPAYFIMRVYYRIAFGVTVDRSGIEDMKGASIVLCPHLSNSDHFLTAFGLFPHRPTFVMSEHFAGFPILRPVMKMMRVITKKMFCADVGTIMNIRRALKCGNTIVLFPEGRLTWYGHSLAVTAGTAELVKSCGVDVYSVTSNGAYLTFPKWRKKNRRGKINITTSKLFAAQEIKDLSLAEISARIDAAILHDDELAMAGTRYRCKDMTEGLDGIIYKCPECMSEFKMTAKNNHITCSECGADWVLDNKYVMHGTRFDRINEWCEWQKQCLDPENDVLESEAVFGTKNEKGNIDHNAGKGLVRLDKTGFYMKGDIFGEDIEAFYPAEKLGGFPITVGSAFDVYYKNKLVYIHPLPDMRTAVKWVTLLDRIHENGNKND